MKAAVVLAAFVKYCGSWIYQYGQ